LETVTAALRMTAPDLSWTVPVSEAVSCASAKDDKTVRSTIAKSFAFIVVSSWPFMAHRLFTTFLDKMNFFYCLDAAPVLKRLKCIETY